MLLLPTVIGVHPWTMLVPGALMAIARSQQDADARDRLAFCMAVAAAGTFVFYSLSASTLASYSLAVLPPLAIVIAIYLDKELASPSVRKALLRPTAGLFVAVAIALLVVMWGGFYQVRELIGGVPNTEMRTLSAIAAPTALLLGGGGVLLLFLRDTERVMAIASVGFLIPVILLLTARPLLADAYPWRRFGQQIARSLGPVWIHTYRAPSLTLYAQRPVNLLQGDEAVRDVVERGESGWLVVENGWLSDGALAHRIAAHQATVVDRTNRLLLIRLNRS
jgi:hypothetical protein